MTVFHRLLGNSLAIGVTSSFLWFALTFLGLSRDPVVVATGVIGSAFRELSVEVAPR